MAPGFELRQGQADYWVGRVVESYRVLSLLGTGGMGEVYLAQDTRLDRKVALKFLPDFMQEDPMARRRFVREAKLAAQLRHTNIVGVIDFGEIGGVHYMTLELVDGIDLRSLNEKDMRAIRGKRISMIFQEPGLSLDPLMPVGKQIEEVLLHHTPAFCR